MDTVIRTMVQRSRWPLVKIAFAALASRFLFAADFGLYEDDWLLVSTSVNTCTHWTELAATTFPYRLLAWPLFDVVGCVVRHGGLASAYSFQFGVYVILLFSIYILVSTLVAERVALVGVIVFTFLPFDTTQASLAHVQIHIALLLMIIACICLVRRRLGWCAILTMFSLLTYDAYLPVLLATALIVIQRYWEERRALLSVALPAVSYLMFRQFVWNSEDRYLYLDLSEPATLVVRILSGTTDLAATALAIPSFVVEELARTSDPSTWVLGLLISTVITWIVYQQMCGARSDDAGCRLSTYSLRRIVAAMLLMAVASLAITASVEHFPQLLGRSGRYFTVASLAVSVVLALGASRFAVRYARRGEAAVLACVCVCMWVASSYAILVQRQLVTIWRHQLTVIDSMFRLVPDLDGRVRVVVLDPAAFRNYGREAMSYTPPFAHLPQQSFVGREVADYSNLDARAFYRDPGSFLHLAAAEPGDVLVADSGGRVSIRRSALSYYPSLQEDVVLRPADTIFLRVRDDDVERLGPFRWSGIEMGRPMPADAGRNWPGSLTKLGAMIRERATTLRTSDEALLPAPP